MEMNHLKYFYEVAKAGSFTAAARKLHVSQSALSKAVATLEASENMRLLSRSKKGVALTPLGMEVFRRSTGIFQTLTEIEHVCRGTKEVCEGPLRFGASDHLTNYFLTEPLQRLREHHPRLVPSVFSGTPHETVNLLFNNDLEFGLFFTKVNVPGIHYETVASLPMAVVCHPALCPQKKKPDLRSLVKSSGFIGSIGSQYQVHPSKALMDVLGKGVPIAFESNSQEAQKRFCLAKGGVAFLARFMVEKELRNGELVEIPVGKPIVFELLLATRTGLPLSLGARTFLEALRFPS